MFDILKKRRLSALDAIKNGYKSIEPKYPDVEGNIVNIATSARISDDERDGYKSYVARKFTDEELDIIFNEYNEYSVALTMALKRATILINKTKKFSKRVFWGGERARKNLLNEINTVIDDVFFMYDNLYAIHQRTGVIPQEIDKFLAYLNGGYSVLDVVPEPYFEGAEGACFRYGDRTYPSIGVMEMWKLSATTSVSEYLTLWQWTVLKSKTALNRIKQKLRGIKGLFVLKKVKELAPANNLVSKDVYVVSSSDYDYENQGKVHDFLVASKEELEQIKVSLRKAQEKSNKLDE